MLGTRLVLQVEFEEILAAGPRSSSRAIRGVCSNFVGGLRSLPATLHVSRP
jgi:hypothetical protein